MRITLVLILIVLSGIAINCKKYPKDDDTNLDQAEDIIKELNDEIAENLKKENNKKYFHHDQINFDDDDKNSDIKQKYDEKNEPRQPPISIKQTTPPPPPISNSPSTPTFDHQEYENSNSWTVFFILCILGKI